MTHCMESEYSDASGFGSALVQARYWDEEQPEAPITRVRGCSFVMFEKLKSGGRVKYFA